MTYVEDALVLCNVQICQFEILFLQNVVTLSNFFQKNLFVPLHTPPFFFGCCQVTKNCPKKEKNIGRYLLKFLQIFSFSMLKTLGKGIPLSFWWTLDIKGYFVKGYFYKKPYNYIIFYHITFLNILKIFNNCHGILYTLF